MRMNFTTSGVLIFETFIPLYISQHTILQSIFHYPWFFFSFQAADAVWQQWKPEHLDARFMVVQTELTWTFFILHIRSFRIQLMLIGFCYANTTCVQYKLNNCGEFMSKSPEVVWFSFSLAELSRQPMRVVATNGSGIWAFFQDYWLECIPLIGVSWIFYIYPWAVNTTRRCSPSVVIFLLSWLA